MGWQAGLLGRQRSQAQDREYTLAANADLLPVPMAVSEPEPEPVSAPVAEKPPA